MKIENLTQGSPEWDAFRLTHFGASEAAAMLGLSKKTTRTKLLDMKATGIPQEYSQWVEEVLFEGGHAAEEAARPIVEGIIGQDLYPVTCSEGELSASCDGLTFDADLPLVAFEHKLWNKELAAAVERNDLPEEYMPQCQQIMMVTGAEQVVFVCSDGTEENMVHMRVYPDQRWFERIISGWAQFKADLANHTPQPKIDKPQAEVIMDLPALSIQVRGDVSIAGNLPRFREEADGYLKNIKTSGFQTDKDFVDAEENAKFCRGTESALELTEHNILAQTASVEEVVKVVRYYREQFRRVAIDLEKAVDAEKKARKLAIVQTAKDAFAAHVASLEVEISPLRLNGLSVPDFTAAMKGTKKLDSAKDAVDTALAIGKISADSMAKDYRDKMSWYKDSVVLQDFAFLFSDLQQIISKPMDDFKLVVQSRIKTHVDAEAEKVERIREEERIKAEAKARAEAEAKLQADNQQQSPLLSLDNVLRAAAPQQIADALAPKPKLVGKRPSDDEIIRVLAMNYRVHPINVITWLMDMDLQAAALREEAKA